MATKDGFQNAVVDALAKVPPGDQSKKAVEKLLDQYSYDIREVALAPHGSKARKQKVDRIDNSLLDELAQLSDTEHDGQEQSEQPADVTPTPSPAPVEPPPPAPEVSSGKPRRQPR